MDLWPNRKRELIYLLAFVGAFFLGIVTSFFYERSAYRGRVVRGIEWSEQVVSGLDRRSLKALLSSKSERARELSIELTLGEERKKFTAGELGISLEVPRAIDRALAAGRDGSVVRNFWFWFGRLFSEHNIPATLSLNEAKLKSAVQPWAETFLQAPELPQLFYDAQLVVTPGRGGSVIEYSSLQSALESEVVERMRNPATSKTSSQIEVPTRVRAATISREALDVATEEARALLRGPISVVAPGGSDEAILSPAVLGAALSSKVLFNESEADKATLHLELSLKPLRKSLESLLKEWERPAAPATFDFPPSGPPVISKSETGRSLNEAALILALLSVKADGLRRITLPLEEKEPELTTLEAEGLRIKGLVVTFTTRHPCCQPRVENIHHAAKQLDGVVLRPGEKFSLNSFLGPRRESSGYHKAPTIVRGEMEDVYGGGISQLATTLFNAVLRGGYEIIQRQPHSVYFPRYPEGHEATVSFPEPDLIFRNDTDAGMVIKTNAAPTFISVLIYGDNGGRVTTVDKGNRYNIVQPPKEYDPDAEMPPEKVKRLRAGQLGWTVLVSRKVKYPDGTEKVEKREVVYNPRPELLRVHPCMIPEEAEGHTGEECPESEIEEQEEELSDDAYFETQ